MTLNTKKKYIKKKSKEWKWLRKTLLVLFIIGFAGLAALFGINQYVKASAENIIITPRQASEMKADCILVLGAGVVGKDNKPSPMLEDRILQGVELYYSGASGKLLMSGDHGRVNYDEVNTMKQIAIGKGVPSKNIFMDHAGFSTYESLYRACDIFETKKIIIVTQKYHLYRALFIAKRLGFDAYGVASDPRDYGGQDYRDAREILARNKDFFYVIFKPQPTYLGEKIPISGNGDLTNDKS
ncbi:MAG: ElyC/SanA/YdcF family protein [Eubacteriales bacterium]